MNPSSFLPSVGAMLAARSTLRVAFRLAWQRLKDSQSDERTRYLSRATDLADLERRMRDWDQPRRPPWLPPP
jgi:Protein of unknown function (DUF3563)